MNSFFTFLENTLMPPMTKLAEQKHLKAIRDGIISTMHLIIIGSFFLIIASPPIPALAELIKPYQGTLLIAFRLTVGFISIYSSYGIGYSLARAYKLDGVSGGVLALCAFLLTFIPENLEGVGWVLRFSVEKGQSTGGQGMFVAIITSIFAVEVLRLCKQSNITFKMPEGVPQSVARSFEALVPGTIIILVIWLIVHVAHFNIHSIFAIIFSPLENLANSFGGVLILIFLITFLWVCGIHGVSVIGTIVRPIWIALFEENAFAFEQGIQAPNIAPEAFFQWFVWIGGSGATIGLAICILFVKSKYLKQLGRASFLPAVFNINEPLIFGTPVMLNPILGIPFIIAPVIMATITYVSMGLNLVARPVATPPWTLPAPIGAYLSTGGDWKAAVLACINIVIAVVIFYPFVKLYDKRMFSEEQSTES